MRRAFRSPICWPLLLLTLGFSPGMLGCGQDTSSTPQGDWSLSDEDEQDAAPPPQDAAMSAQDAAPDLNVPDAQDQGETPPEALFTSGRWVLMDTYPRGGITADIYRFEAGGALVLEKRYDAAGVVYRCVGMNDTRACRFEEVPQCRFGRKWAASADQLEIEGVCEDGVKRPIVLTLTPDEAVSEAYRMQVERVGEEREAWHLVGFDGALDSGFLLQRCDALDGFCPTP